MFFGLFLLKKNDRTTATTAKTTIRGLEGETPDDQRCYLDL